MTSIYPPGSAHHSLDPDAIAPMTFRDAVARIDHTWPAATVNATFVSMKATGLVIGYTDRDGNDHAFHGATWEECFVRAFAGIEGPNE